MTPERKASLIVDIVNLNIGHEYASEWEIMETALELAGEEFSYATKVEGKTFLLIITYRYGETAIRFNYQWHKEKRQYVNAESL